MFGKNKLDSFFEFYYAVEGKKLLALAELFLDQMNEKITSGEITDLTYDYRYSTPEYSFELIYSKRMNGHVSFFVYDRKNNWNRIELTFSSASGEIIDFESRAFFLHKNQGYSVHLHPYALFQPLKEKMRKLVFRRFVEIEIPQELIDCANNIPLQNPVQIVAQARELLQNHRSLFCKKMFSNVAHTIKTIEQTLPLLEKKNSCAAELTQMIKRDLVGVIEEYVQLPEERRIKQEEKLLYYMNRFYLQALDVQEILG